MRLLLYHNLGLEGGPNFRWHTDYRRIRSSTNEVVESFLNYVRLEEE